jgi:SH3-like domain-containing protein
MHFTVPTLDWKTATLHAARDEARARTQNLLKYVLAFTLLFIGMTVHAREMVSVTGSSLNMRSGAGIRYQTVWELSQGYPLSVTGREGNWLKVRDFENDEGWVYRSLTGKAPHYIVETRIANIRSRPDTKSRVVGKARYGDVLGTVENRREWVKIKDANGLQGWVARRLLWGW